MAGSMMSMIKGVTVGLATGMVVGYVGKKMLDDGSDVLKKKADKAIDTMEDVADTARYIAQ